MAPFPLPALEIDDHTTLILFIIVQSIYTLILCPLSIFYSHKLWKLHKEKVLFITKRRPQNVIFGVVLLNFYSIIVHPFTDLPRIWHVAEKYDDFHLRMGLIDVIHLFIYGLFCRIWLLYYDYERCMQSLSMEWQKHILIKKENYTPWTLKYKYLGNTKIIFMITIIFWIVAMFIIQLGSFVFGEYYANGSQAATVFPPIFGAIIIAFKIRKWNDTFYLKRELQLCAFCCFLLFAIYVCIIVPFLDLFWNIRLIIGNIVVCGWCYCLVFISTQWVIKQYRKQCAAILSDKQLSLEDILSTERGFKLFANYLVKEFSIEHLFFLFEIMKLKNELIVTEMVNRNDAGIVIKMKYIDEWIANKVIKPKTIKQIKHSLKYIICQYIAIESEQCVNISARIRQNILKLSLDDERVSDITMSMEEEIHSDHDTDSFQEIQTVNTNSSIMMRDFDISIYLKKFDGAIEEVIKLLTCDSLIRFYESNEYQQMIKHIHTHHHDDNKNDNNNDNKEQTKLFQH